MNILLIGSGGREHALAWKISQSQHCSQLFIAPGNAGTSSCGTNVNIAVTDFESIKNFCLHAKIDMLVVGPEEPLVKGITDMFKTTPSLAHIAVIGPSQEGAQLEGSKAYAKAFMQRHNISTAAYREFNRDNFAEGIDYIRNHSLPIVLKADGLAAGKGVLICQSHEEALAEYELMLQRSKFGDAGNKVVIEAFLDGIELSMFALTDGNHYVLLPEAKDYKRIGEKDTGLNTGGMGAVSPVDFAEGAFMQKVIDRIVEPTISGLKKENIDYKGFVFFGLIKVGQDPYVIEYNCRMGDPETEVVIPRLKNDIVELFQATTAGKLQDVKIVTDQRRAVTVVAVSGGYPGDYKKGAVINGLDKVQADDSIVFHAGTKEQEGSVLTNGGRVLAITSFADTTRKAVEKSKSILGTVGFEGMYFRNDIGHEFF